MPNKEYDFDEELLMDDEDYERVQHRHTRERTQRLTLEAQPYLLDDKKELWTSNIIWENEVKPSKKLLHMVGAFNMIDSYVNGVPLENIYNNAFLFGEEDYKGMLAELVKYFKQGQELADQLQSIKVARRGK